MAIALFPWEPATGLRKGHAALVPTDAHVPYPVAQCLRNRQFLWLRRCKLCGRLWIGLAQRKTCSRTCGNALGYFDPARERQQRRHLRKVLDLARAARWQQQERRIARIIRGLSPAEIYRLAYRKGYDAGHKAGRGGYERLAS